MLGFPKDRSSDKESTMPKSSQKLTKRQEDAVKRFVRTQEDVVKGTGRLYRARLRALKTALNAGVYPPLLAKRSGLATSRVYQLKDKINEENGVS